MCRRKGSRSKVKWGEKELRWIDQGKTTERSEMKRDKTREVKRRNEKRKRGKAKPSMIRCSEMRRDEK